MSSLILIRHGQAAASGSLTALGERQARLLGAYWRDRKQRFDQTYCGTLPRQRQTAELAGFPAPEFLPELNEYDAGGIVGRLGARLAAESADYAALVGAWEREPTNRNFQRMFEVVVRRWVEGTLADPEVEPWTAFHERVRQALRRLTSNGPSRQIAAFTSGGVIGVMVQSVLGAPGAAAVELNWRVRNGSLTGFLFSGGRVSLDYFNATPHLGDEEISYR
jgi:broad specificity phosphatase PhoE